MKIFKKTDFGIVQFGKYAGKKWDELPESYLEFLLTKECYTSDANKKIAKKELQQRNVLDGQFEMDIVCNDEHLENYGDR